MFIGVPFCIYRLCGKVATVVFVGVQLIFGRFIYIGATSRWELLNSHGITAGADLVNRFPVTFDHHRKAVRHATLILIFERLPINT